MYGVKNYLFLCSSAILTVGLASHAYAGPEGGSVAAGNANITQGTKVTDIHQSSSKAIIDWTSFDVAGDEAVNFHQPDSGSITLNRIHDHKASQIDGSITANGHVMLLNQNGVVFGAGSKVDVGSLTVSTADIDNDDFMAGRLDFNQAGQSDAAIINHGTITAKEAGLISLVAPEVENNGVIIAKLGKVQMAAADTFSLDLAGDGLIQVAVSDEDAKKLASNTGRITAEGGYVAITAGHARNIIDSVVENSGVIEAHSMTKVGGKIVLSADRGITKMSGTMNASGLTGGGSIKIGGDYQGSGEDGTANSARTFVSEDAIINASATQTGNGGQTIIWADERTYFYGDIDASGIEQGGFAEVSGKQYLDFNGNVDLAGAKLGTLLLDPDDLDIVAGAANPADFADDQILFAENAGGTSTIGADTISGRLTANANVILQANNTIDVDAAITSTGAGDLTLETAAGGVITVNAAIDVNSGNLTLKADEIDILANLSGTGDVQLTSADINQEIEIGSTDASDLNLTATELAFLQDGWNSITIGGSDHEASITVNEALNISDHLYIRNKAVQNADHIIDINANITTTDSSDLYLYGNGSAASAHGWAGVHVGADLNIDRDIYMNSSNRIYMSTNSISAGRDFIVGLGNSDLIDTNLTVGRNMNYLSSWMLTVAANASINVDGDISIETPRVSIDSTATISGNVSGTSSLVFKEYGEDGAMELGGTSAGHAWQMESSEIATIQDGFSSITFGSTSMTGDIQITGDVSFSDDTFIKTKTSGGGVDPGVSVTGDITTTDGADLTIETQQGGTNLSYVGFMSTGDFDIAGDLSISTLRRTLLWGTGALNVGGDLTLTSQQENQGATKIENYASVNIGGNANLLSSGSDSHIMNVGDVDIGGDLILTGGSPGFLASDQAPRLENITSLDVVGDVTLNATDTAGTTILKDITAATIGGDLVVNANETTLSALTSDITVNGDTTIIATAIDLQNTLSLSGNVSGTSSLVFKEYGEDGAMELGGTSAGHTWQMTATEIATIQDGFSSITFGSASFTEAIDITGAVSFSDNVNFYNTGDNSTIHVTGAFTTTDSANVVMESGSAANMGWDSVNIDADMNIAGDLTTRSGAGTGSGHVDVNNTNMIIGGDWLIDSDNSGYIVTTTLNVGGDLSGVLANNGQSLSKYIFSVGTATVGGDLSLYSHEALTLNGDFDVGGNVVLDNSAKSTGVIAFQSGTMDFAGSLDVVGSNRLGVSNAVITADGNISFESSEIDVTGVSSISGNTGGTSTLTFLENGEDEAMELGGTSAGHTWQMTSAEIATIQDGFSSITFGSSSMTGGIDVTGNISFSDDVIFRQDQLNATSGYSFANSASITTTDSANASFYGDNSYSLTNIKATVDGDLLLDGFSTITLSNTSIAGDLTIQNNSSNSGLHSGVVVNVGGDALFNIPAFFQMGFSSSSTLNVDGDLTITASDVDIYTGSSISGNAGGSSTLTFLEYNQNGGMEIGATNTGYAWQMDDNELAAINSNFSSVVFGSSSMSGDITIDSWDLNAKAYDVSLMANDIDVLGMSLGAGDVTLISSNDINLNAAVGNNAQGGDVHFVAGNEFINNVGAAGINAGNGRYLVYAASPAQVTKNGLSASNLYQRTYALNPPSSLASSSDYFVFASVDPTPAPPQSSNAIPEDFTPSVEYQVAANNFDNLLSGLPVVPGLNISNRISSVNDTPIKLKKDVALNRFANSREIYADVRLLEAELLKVDEPIVREYDLCSHSDLYCR